MIPTRRTVRTSAAAALLAAVVLTGCAEEEPVTPAPTSSEPAPDATETVTETATQTTDDAAETTAAADDEDATTAPGDAADDTAATADPAEGTELTSADGAFVLTIPDGWDEVTDVARDLLPEEDRDTLLLAAQEVERKDDFFTNVVITQEEYVGNLTSAVEDTAEQLAGEDGEFELLDPVEVDGNRAPGYTVIRDINGSTVHQTQHFVSHDGTLYSVTLSAVEPQAEAAADVLAEVMASWAWQD